MRRMFVCLKCRSRKGLHATKDPPEFVPECQLHGFPRAPAGLKPAA